MKKPKYGCWKCNSPCEFVRVDLHPAPQRGCHDHYSRERGLGAERCSNPDCEDHTIPEGMERMSYGREFWQFIKDHLRCGSGRWTDRCDRHVDHALRLAIQTNMEFFPWDAEFIPFNDAHYTFTCLPHRGDTVNGDAARAMEKHWARPPFILEGKRLACAAKFWWRDAGRAVEVSSIRDREVDGNREDYLVCICYPDSSYDDTRGGKRRQFKLTREQLKAAEKAGNATWERWHPERAIAERQARRLAAKGKAKEELEDA